PGTRERLRGADRGGRRAEVLRGRPGVSTRALPLFPVTTVGSWPRPAELVRALAARRRGEGVAETLREITDRAVRQAVAVQEEAGVDLVPDGEQGRDNFYSFV